MSAVEELAANYAARGAAIRRERDEGAAQVAAAQASRLQDVRNAVLALRADAANLSSAFNTSITVSCPEVDNEESSVATPPRAQGQPRTQSATPPRGGTGATKTPLQQAAFRKVVREGKNLTAAASELSGEDRFKGIDAEQILAAVREAEAQKAGQP